MTLIYEPQGSARSDAALACNVYKGCDHACKYCYAPSATFNKREQFNAHPARRPPAFLRDLEREAMERATASVGGHVLLCFTCDPYQTLDVEAADTRRVIRILHRTGHTIVTLTKGGTRALRDLDLFTPRDEFASTLTTTSEDLREKWEPGTAKFEDRCAALKQFYDAGIPTWVSLEPVLYEAEVFKIIEATRGFVGHYRVGKLNRNAHANTIDWRGFAERVIRYMTDNGVPFFVKKELLPFVPAGFLDTYNCRRP